MSIIICRKCDTRVDMDYSHVNIVNGDEFLCDDCLEDIDLIEGEKDDR